MGRVFRGSWYCAMMNLKLYTTPLNSSGGCGNHLSTVAVRWHHMFSVTSQWRSFLSSFLCVIWKKANLYKIWPNRLKTSEFLIKDWKISSKLSNSGNSFTQHFLTKIVFFDFWLKILNMIKNSNIDEIFWTLDEDLNSKISTPNLWIC